MSGYLMRRLITKFAAETCAERIWKIDHDLVNVRA